MLTTLDPYCALVEAILHRAVQDARGICAHVDGTRVSKTQVQREALAWLQDAARVRDLVELTGCDAGAVLRRVAQLVAHKERDHAD